MATFNVDGQKILDLMGGRAIPSQVMSSAAEVML